MFQLVDSSPCQIRLRESVLRVVCFIKETGRDRKRERERRASSPFPFVEFTEFTVVLQSRETLRKHRLRRYFSLVFSNFSNDLSRRGS